MIPTKDFEILIVEDSLTQAVQLQHVLEQNGYNSVVVRNGMKAIEYLHNNRKNKRIIIISDVVMPEMDGFQLCKQIKEDGNLKDIPVVLLTSLSNPKDIVKGLQCGAENFILKPFSEQALLSRIQYIMINSELRKGTSAQMGMEVFFDGQRYFVNTNRMQIIDLLFSTYDAVAQKGAELERAHDELKEQALKDGLTGLLSKKGFAAMSEQPLKAATRTKRIAAVLFADIDNMKWINDIMGRQAGDLALKQVADALRRTFRQMDIIARVGGDEFAVLLIEPGEDSITSIFKRLHDNLEIYNNAEAGAYTLSLSMGIAYYNHEQPCSIDELLARAKKHMDDQR